MLPKDVWPPVSPAYMAGRAATGSLRVILCYPSRPSSYPDSAAEPPE